MKILTNSQLSPEIESELSKRSFEILTINVAQQQLPNYINTKEIEALLVQRGMKVTKLLIESCKKLKLIIFADNLIDLELIDFAKKSGIKVLWAEKAISNATAEMVFAHLLGGCRLLQESNRNMPLEGEINFKSLQESYSNGIELSGKTLGIIGMNETGKKVAQKAIGLGMQVIYWDDKLQSVSEKVELYNGVSFIVKLESKSFEEVLNQADFLTVHTSNYERYILNKETFIHAKKLKGIINCAYPEAVNEVVLVDLINEEKLLFAGLDRFEEEPFPAIQVLMQPAISLSPNTATSSQEVQEKIWEEIYNKIIDIN